MGCAIFPQQKNSLNNFHNKRGNKKTQMIDGRKRSSQALDRVVENVTTSQDNIDEQSIAFASKILHDHSLFCTLETNEIDKIASSMKFATAVKGQFIFKEGDPSACFFVIKEGSVGVEIEGQQTKTLGKGETFGELALIYHSKRTASIKCLTDDLQMLFLKSKQFKQILKSIRDKYNEKTKALIDNVQIFSLLTNKQKYTMLNSLVREHYKKGTVLFQKNDIPVCFYIIESGKVSLVFNDPNKKDIILGELESFGESTFRKNGKREGTATVEEDLVCMTINEDKMKQCLGGTLSSIVFHNIKKWALKSSYLFQQFDNKEIDQIAMEFMTKHTKTGGIIMQAQKPVNALVICVEGKINSKQVGTLFNDEFYNVKGAKLETDLVKNDAGVYAILGFDRLKEIMDNFNSKGSVAVARKRQSLVMKENQSLIDLDSLEYLLKLGQGQFGLVHLVKDKKSGNLFALKCLQKQKIKQQEMEESAISQREILASLCHPLIVGYYKAYQDRKNIYFLLEYIYGIEMFDAIRQIGLLNRMMARFYLGSLILAVEYLHSRNIIYRDIKPQNSIVNSQGRVFLIDMGTAKMLKSQNGYRTATIIGTPHYMAPEVMQSGKGYSFEADYWSFGVIFYELICGKLPFVEDEESPYKIYAYIMQNQVEFPTFLTDEPAKTLIKKLLNKNVSSRLVGGFTELKNSQYFEGFNWDDLYTGKMVPPYVPRRFRTGNNSKYSQMQGYPLREFLYDKKKGGKRLTQEFEIWTNNVVI